MSTDDTTEPETVENMLDRLCAVVKGGGDPEPVRQEIVARFTTLEDACDEALASLGAAYAAMSATAMEGCR